MAPHPVPAAMGIPLAVTGPGSSPGNNSGATPVQSTPLAGPSSAGAPVASGTAMPGGATVPGGAAVMDRETERVRKPSPRYRVLLHNDPVNSMEYVVVTLRQVVPSLSEQDAIAVMLEAHNTGVGLVIVCDLEPAEFYCETLKAKGLSSRLEPDS
jgi:ATP-dependent Clp protease adaptor protein ClpS